MKGLNIPISDRVSELGGRDDSVGFVSPYGPVHLPRKYSSGIAISMMTDCMW